MQDIKFPPVTMARGVYCPGCLTPEGFRFFVAIKSDGCLLGPARPVYPFENPDEVFRETVAALDAADPIRGL